MLRSRRAAWVRLIVTTLLGIFAILNFVRSGSDFDGPSEFRVRCVARDGVPLEGLRFEILREPANQSQWIELYPPIRDNSDPTLYSANLCLPAASNPPQSLDALFQDAEVTLFAKATSHGTVAKVIDSADAEIVFETPASLAVQFDPPFDPRSLKGWHLTADSTNPRIHQVFSDSVAVKSSMVDGVLRMDALQPGGYQFRLVFMEPMGEFEGGGTNPPVGTVIPSYELVSGPNEIVLER